jgi:hypothetical protein
MRYGRMMGSRRCNAYSSIFGRLSMTAFESNEMTFVLETLGSDQTLDSGSFGVGFLALAFGLHFAADDEFTDLWESVSWEFLLIQD